MAALSIAFVVVGFLSEAATEAEAARYVAIEIGLTVFFTFEFVTRIAAARDRRAYLRGHWIDLLALIPTIRGFRLFRLVRLLRLVRAFAGVYRALSRIERFSSNRTLVMLFMAWLTVAIICSATFFFAEHEANDLINDPMDAFWWGITTLSTVGYGRHLSQDGRGSPGRGRADGAGHHPVGRHHRHHHHVPGPGQGWQRPARGQRARTDPAVRRPAA